MDDEDDVPEELWDAIDNIGNQHQQQQNQTVSQAHYVFFQQQQRAPGPQQISSVNPSYASSNAQQWRPNLVQQVPAGPPPKPKSLAQQLLGDSSNFLPRHGFQAGPSTNSTQQRWTPPQTAWGAATPNGTAKQQQQPQQQQPWQDHHRPPAGGPPGAGRGSAAAMLAAGIGLPPLSNGGVGPAATAGTFPAPGAAPVQADAAQQQQQQQQQQPPDGPDDLQRLQRELQQQLMLANQLRSQLAAAQNEKMQQERQQMQQRLQGSSQPSLAQHRAQELQRQVVTYQERLRFAEEEARQAEAASAAKAARATQAEVQLKALQDDMRRKEDVLQQLQVELNQEKQRTARLAATAAAGGAGHAGGASSSNLQPQLAGFASPPGTLPAAGGGGGGVGSSGRKRRGGVAAAAAGATPGRSSCGKPAAAGATNSRTPQQQLRHQQMTQLLGAVPATSVSFDIDMYDDIDDDMQQEEQQQQPAEPNQQPAEKAPVAAQSQQAAPAAAAQPSQAQQLAPPQQEALPLQQQQQDQTVQQPQQQEQPGRQQQEAEAVDQGAAAQAQPLPPPPPSLSSSFATKLLPALQSVQISSPKLPQLLWSSCRPAMQQLLQPLSSQLLGLGGMLAAPTGLVPGSSKGPATSSTTTNSCSSNMSQLVPTALSVAQEQLGLVSAGVVSTGSALLISLLRLAAVLVPEGPLAAGSSEAARGSDDGGDHSLTAAAAAAAAATAAAAMHAAFPAVGDHQQGGPPKWLLVPLQRADPDGNPDAVGLKGSTKNSLQEQQQQQQVGQFLVFRSALDPTLLHVLPLNLAVAVLQLVRQLVADDTACLQLVAAELSRPGSPHSSSCIQRQHSIGRAEQPCSGRSLQAVDPDASSKHSRIGSSSSRVQFDWAEGAALCSNTAHHPPHRQQQHPWRTSFQAGTTGLLAASQSCLIGASMQAPAAAAAGRSWASSSDTSWRQQQQQQQQHVRGVPWLLLDAARCHSTLLQHVGMLLAAVAAQLPVNMQDVLRPLVLSDGGLLTLLLQADCCASRCAAAALLQQLLSSPAVAAAVATALTHPAAQGGDQQQCESDVIMIDVTEDQPGSNAALQPLNHRTAAAARAAAAGSSRQGKVPQQHHQQQQLTTACTPSHSDEPLSQQAVQDVVLQLLESFSFGLDEAFMTLQQDLDHHRTSTAAHALAYAASNNNSSSRDVQQPFWGGSSAGGSCVSLAGCWGVFELQRRCCAVMASALHSQQHSLLLYSMDQTATAGYGLAQRLLVMVDAACSPVSGDPFATLKPILAAAAPAAPAAATTPAAMEPGPDAPAVGSSVCGSPCSWSACLERLRLAHEGLLLLRSLVATPGDIGTAAMADLASNSSSLRLIMTTRAKIAEVTTALTAAAAAAAAVGNGAVTPAAAALQPGTNSSYASSSSAAAAGVMALPLQPWAWPWSVQCGCWNSSIRGSGASSSSWGPGQQVLHAERPSLQSVLQEMGNTAASIHRRVMIYLRSLETGMMQL